MDRVRIGIVGVGNIAPLNVAGYHEHERCDVVALCDPREDKARAMAAEWGVPHVKLLAIIAAREGIDEVFAQFPDTQIYVCAIDPDLNAKKYIVPGLGDAGDRIFNTQAPE